MRRRELLLLAATGCLGAWWLLRSDAAETVGESITSGSSPSTAITTRIGQASSPLPASLPASLLHTTPRYPTESPEKAYLSDRVMLRVDGDSSLLAVARDHGTRVARLPGPSGYGSLWIPSDSSLADMRAELLDDERVLDVSAVGVMRGASLPVAWQVEATKQDEVTAAADYSAWVVAVLDTGVAYEAYSDEQGSYVQAANLAGNDFVAPWDFVNGDAHPNDDHQHGTHIACTIACEGALDGYAPGATIMPIKVLDADNCGIETDLVDAIWHAVDHDADVINMSLSFGHGYVLSTALDEALNAAHEAGIVLMGASGNDGLFAVTYPAAHPKVFAVGSSTLKDDDKQQAVDYSNRDPAVDLLAPGGSLDADENGDGYPDGILAETIDYQDPTSTGYWFYAGTSQATAVASGAAVWLLEEGASRDEVYTALQLGADSLQSVIEDGYGSGRMRLKETLDKLADAKATDVPQRFVAMMPYLKDCDDELEPNVLLTVLDENGTPLDAGKIFGTFTDQDGLVTVFKCDTNSDGQCTAKIDKVDKYDEATGEEIAWAWAIRVATAYDDKVSSHPGTAFFATDALEILLAAMDGAGIATSPLGLKWDGAVDYPDMDDVSDAYVFPNLGTGIATSPLGVIATPPMIEPYATMDTVAIDLDGAGIATSPLGVVQLPRLIFDGTGIATSPLGLTQITIIPIGGVGIATSPLGFTPPTLLDPMAVSYQEPTLMLGVEPIFLGGTGIATSPLGVLGGHTTTLLDSGGWALTDGMGLGTAMAGTGIGAFMGTGEGVVASGAGSEPLQ